MPHLHRIIALALMILAGAAPAAQAKLEDRNAISIAPAPIQDLRSPDTRDLANGYAPPPVQDLRSPDTRDLANGYAPTSAMGRRDGIDTTALALLAFALVASAVVLGSVARSRRARMPA